MAIWNCRCHASGEEPTGDDAMRAWRVHYNTEHGPAIPIAEIRLDAMPAASPGASPL